ncbi:hypothetical protein OsJ_35739 [Oryza sativa Japonica Group]|uniref:Uncharacterized protein n=1 Tax=Oryza sativa subsp. japonica TaxID=39947 RepID=A3CGC7_ORYSJ|nr:hypothetical protein OsJ_35739 [Oryza sativa Japonica Group]
MVLARGVRGRRRIRLPPTSGRSDLAAAVATAAAAVGARVWSRRLPLDPVLARGSQRPPPDQASPDLREVGSGGDGGGGGRCSCEESEAAAGYDARAWSQSGWIRKK